MRFLCFKISFQEHVKKFALMIHQVAHKKVLEEKNPQ